MSVLRAVFRDRRRFVLAVRVAVFLALFVPQLVFGFWARVAVLALGITFWTGEIVWGFLRGEQHPSSARYDDVLTFVKSLGFDPNSVREVHLSPGSVEVTEFCRDDTGALVAVDDDLMTVTKQVQFDRES